MTGLQTQPAAARTERFNHRGKPNPPDLRDHRIARGIGLRDLATKTAINRGVLSQIERGQRIVTPAEGRKIAEALETDPRGWRTIVLFVYEDPVA